MIRYSYDLPTDITAAIAEQARKTPGLMQTAVNRSTASLRRRLKGELSRQPGAPKYPLRWKSARQRRAFFATDGFGKGIPYRRTGALSRGWVVDFKVDSDGGSVIVQNDVPYSIYVQGDYAQPFHLDTGWPQAAPIVVRYEEQFVNSMIETWFTVADPFAGVPKK